MNDKRWTFGWFLEKDPSLKRPTYSVLEGPYSDFLGHLNSHSDREPWYPVVSKYCPFCKIVESHLNEEN
jgi:hypothetical protein